MLNGVTAMKVSTYSQEGKKLQTKLELKDEIFGAKPNADLVAQYVRVYLANQRLGTAKTKNRGEVSGGGRKPWRQKGTGRARHGSIRSPLWVGGGITHGPEPKNWGLKMPQKMRRASLLSALSAKMAEGAVKILNRLSLGEIKTGEMLKILENLKVTDKKVLLVLEALDQNVILSARNLPKVRTIQANELNAYEVLSCDWLVTTKGAVGVLEKVFQRRRKKAVEQ